MSELTAAHQPARAESAGTACVAWLKPLLRALVVVFLGAVFFRASNTPIDTLDTWNHWKYGQWIWEHGRLPDREPFSPYSDRHQILVDSAWLSQLTCYLVYARSGMEGIALLYGLLEVAKAALYLAAFRRISGSLLLGLAGVALLYGGSWTYFGCFRPQIIGEVFWAALLFAVAAPLPARAALVGMPLCFLLWANVHGAFSLGLLFLVVLVIGRFLDRAWALGNPAAALGDRQVQRLGLLLLLSLAGVCINPYGPALLLEVARFGNLPILQNIKEWQPMTPLATFGGKVLVGSVFLVFATVRLSPRRFSASEVGLLVVFGLSAWFAARMFPWWMAIWPFVLLPHWRALLDQWNVHRSEWETATVSSSRLRRHSGWHVFTLAGAAAALVLLLVSGSGQWLLSQQPRPVQKQVSANTPLKLTTDLKAWMTSQAGTGAMPLRVFDSVLWCDYLLWELPPSARVYWYSHWHCFPPERMAAGQYLVNLEPPPHDWRTILDQYRFNALVLQAEDPPSPLFEYLLSEDGRPGAQWEIIARDGDPLQPGARSTGLVAVRRVDPFVLALANAQGVQGCLGGLGMVPMASNWAFLTHLPWSWAK